MDLTLNISTSFGETCYAGTHGQILQEVYSKHRKMLRRSYTLRDTYKKGPQTRENGREKTEHSRDKTRTHLSASQRKVGLGELHLGPVDPLSRPTLDRLPSRCSLVGDLILSSRSRCPCVSI